MFKYIIKFFDKLEDKIRVFLSKHLILYAIIGGVAIVLFWRGVWETADMFPFFTGPISIIVSTAIMLLTGLFVSFFIGDRIVLSGLKREKKLEEKTEEEVRMDVVESIKILEKLEIVEKDLKELKDKIK